MAVKTFYSGGLGPFIYNTDTDISDPNGLFPGEKLHGFITNGDVNISGETTLAPASGGTETDKILISDGGVVKYRTAAQIATEIGAAGGAAHDILDGSVHTDSVADGVTRGSIIYGNATPKWDELTIGAANTFLGSDGTDISWKTDVLIDDDFGSAGLMKTDGAGSYSIVTDTLHIVNEDARIKASSGGSYITCLSSGITITDGDYANIKLYDAAGTIEIYITSINAGIRFSTDGIQFGGSGATVLNIEEADGSLTNNDTTLATSAAIIEHGNANWGGGGGGVTDHGALTGLGDNDHSAVYSVLAHDHATVGFGLNDNIHGHFGTGDDLTVWHDGSNAYINNITGYTLLQIGGATALTVRSDGIRIKNAGAVINEFETSLTNDATHVPTSSAVYAAVGGGGSMTWPAAAGIALYAGGDAWGTSITAPDTEATHYLDGEGNWTVPAGGGSMTWPNIGSSKIPVYAGGDAWSGTSAVIDNLTDVADTGRASGDLLEFDGIGFWKPRSLTELELLQNVNLSSPATYDILARTGGGEWANITPYDARSVSGRAGFMIGLNNQASYFMNGTGAWSIPAGSGGGSVYFSKNTGTYNDVVYLDQSVAGESGYTFAVGTNDSDITPTTWGIQSAIVGKNLIGGPGILGWTKTGNGNVGAMGAQAVTGYAETNNAAHGYGAYFEARMTNASGWIQGCEAAATSTVATLLTHPGNVSTAGGCNAFRASAGISDAAVDPSAAMVITHTSYGKFKKGIIFSDGALTDLSTIEYTAIEMAPNHTISWTSDGSTGSRFNYDGTQFNFFKQDGTSLMTLDNNGDLTIAGDLTAEGSGSFLGLDMVVDTLRAGTTDYDVDPIPNWDSKPTIFGKSLTGNIGVAGWSETVKLNINPDGSTGGAMGTDGISGAVINNGVHANHSSAKTRHTAYACYLEAHKENGTGGNTHGIEVAIVEKDADAWNPNPDEMFDPRIIINGGTDPDVANAQYVSAGAWISAGKGGVSNQNPSCALGIVNVGSSFKKGIVFSASSIASIGGQQVAIQMADDHRISWSDQNNAISYSTGTGLNSGYGFFSSYGWMFSIPKDSRAWCRNGFEVNTYSGGLGGFWVNGVQVADYVFEDDYDLMTLDDLKAYIDENTKLPGFTSGEDAEDKNNATICMDKSLSELVVKAEEQVLYILQLHERIKQIEERSSK